MLYLWFTQNLAETGLGNEGYTTSYPQQAHLCICTTFKENNFPAAFDPTNSFICDSCI